MVLALVTGIQMIASANAILSRLFDNDDPKSVGSTSCNQQHYIKWKLDLSSSQCPTPTYLLCLFSIRSPAALHSSCSIKQILGRLCCPFSKAAMLKWYVKTSGDLISLLFFKDTAMCHRWFFVNAWIMAFSVSSVHRCPCTRSCCARFRTSIHAEVVEVTPTFMAAL